jgi:hypothetical protein
MPALFFVAGLVSLAAALAVFALGNAARPVAPPEDAIVKSS